MGEEVEPLLCVLSGCSLVPTEMLGIDFVTAPGVSWLSKWANVAVWLPGPPLSGEQLTEWRLGLSARKQLVWLWFLPPLPHCHLLRDFVAASLEAHSEHIWDLCVRGETAQTILPHWLRRLQSGKLSCRTGVPFMLYLDKDNQKWNQCRQNLGFTASINQSMTNRGSLKHKVTNFT